MVVLSLLAGGVGWAAPPAGESRSLGFRFKVQGDDASWCGEQVSVRLSATKAGAFSKNPEGLQQSIGRIRAIVASYCPGASRISFTGIRGKKTVYRAAAWRLARWRLLELDEAGVPRCVPAGVACKERSEALTHLLGLMTGSAFKDVEFTSFLAPESTALVEWRDTGGNVGQMKLLSPGAQAAQGIPAALIADRILAGLTQACAADGPAETLATSDRSELVALRGIRCASPSAPSTQYLVVERRAAGFYVYTFGSFSTDIDVVFGQAFALATALAPK